MSPRAFPIKELLTKEPLIRLNRYGVPHEQECKYRGVVAGHDQVGGPEKWHTYICGRASAVHDVTCTGLLPTPDGGWLFMAQHTFNAPVCGDHYMRVATLYAPSCPGGHEGPGGLSWAETASMLCSHKVRIVAASCRSGPIPLLVQLQKLSLIHI